MNIIRNLAGALRFACLWVAIGATVLLFGVVAFNVVGRAIFDATGGSLNPMIFGAIELSQYALMISVFAAVPAMLGTGMIRVDILSRNFPSSLQSILDRIWLFLMAGFAGVLTVAFWDFAHTAFERGDQTQDLRWPLWPFYGIATLECAALTLLSLAQASGLAPAPDAEREP